MKTATVSKCVLALLVLLLLVAGVATLFQRQIGLALMKRVVDQRISRDVAAELPDGLHVVLCGSGSPMADPKRAGPCTWKPWSNGTGP